jgi:hypothetical protein
MAFSPWNTSQYQYSIPASSGTKDVNGTSYNVQYDQNGTPISAVTPNGAQAINLSNGQTFAPGSLGGFASNIMNSPIPLAGGLMGGGLMGLGSGAASSAAPALTGTDAAMADLAAGAPSMSGAAPAVAGADATMAGAPAAASAAPAAASPIASGATQAAASGAAASLAKPGGGLLSSIPGGLGTALGAGALLGSAASSGTSLPSTPDYKAAAEATAAANRVNQVTPYGSLTYAQTGVDAQGNPIYTQTQKLSDAQQQLLNQQNQTSLGLGGSIDKSLGYVNQSLANPFDTSALPAQQINPGQTAQDAIMARLNPQFDRRQAALETQLANQGIARGTEAWNAAQTDLNNARNDATTQAALQGINLGQQARQQALQEQSFLRSEPINTLNSLRTGAQVSNPTFGATPQGANYSNAMGQQYQANLGQYNAGQAQKNAINNGLFGLGSAFLGTTTGRNALNNLFGG